MKKLTVLFSLLTIILCAQAQTVPSPEFNNEPAYYDTGTHAMTTLEKSQYRFLNQAKGLYGKESGFYMDTPKSTVRFKTSKLQFIVKVTPGTNPSTLLDLGQFEIRGDRRVFITGKLTGMGTKATTSYEKITCQVQKLAECIYLMTPPPLKPGEYMFGSHDNLFAFAIE